MFTPLSESKKPQIYGGTQNFQKLGAKKNKKIKKYPDKSLGRQLNLALNFSAILLAVTPGYIIATLPSGFVPTNSNQYFAVPVKIGSTWETGMARLDSTGTVYIYRANQVNFPGSTAIQCTFSGTFVFA